MFRGMWTKLGTKQIWLGVLAASAGIAVADEEPSVVTVQAVANETTTQVVSTDEASDPRRGWYLSASGAWQHRSQAHEVGMPTTFLIFNDGGFAVNGALGYRFGRVRVEGEYSFANNEVDIAGAAGLQSTGPGNVNLYILMANFAYDLPIGDTPWRVYLGAGIGTFQSEINSLRPDFFAAVPPAFGGPLSPVNTRSNFPFAYQLRTGVGYQLSERTETFVGYRYFDGDKLTFSAPPFNTSQPNGAHTHMIEWGFRIAF